MSDEADMLVLLKMISTLEKKLEQAEADRQSLLNSIYAACNGMGCLNAHELRQALDAAVRKRDVLAAEVRAWRDADASHKLLEAIDACDVYGHRHAVENAQKEVDASGALQRAKEADK